MMRFKTRILAPFCALGAISLFALPASAQKMRMEGPGPDDPVMQMAQHDGPRNQFTLYSMEDTELIRFSSPRDIELCVGMPNAKDAMDARKAVGLTVSWDGQTGSIAPGNCMSFDAKKVKVKPSAPLGDDEMITGRFRVIH